MLNAYFPRNITGMFETIKYLENMMKGDHVGGAGLHWRTALRWMLMM